MTIIDLFAGLGFLTFLLLVPFIVAFMMSWLVPELSHNEMFLAALKPTEIKKSVEVKENDIPIHIFSKFDLE